MAANRRRAPTENSRIAHTQLHVLVILLRVHVGGSWPIRSAVASTAAIEVSEAVFIAAGLYSDCVY
jgi:hypothetical protein